jgi:diguanylate cyclase (GGDEF)-like protein
MQTQPNKLGKGSRKRTENLKSATKSLGASTLSFKVASPTPFGADIPQLNFRREKEAVDVVFQTLLSNTNHELARLVRDVRRSPQARLHGAARHGRISDLLMRAVRCATKQYMVQAELGNLALTDELTGFFNRRGFQALAERQLKLGRRSGRAMLLFFIDVDGLKQTNDSFGHAEGDQALKRTAETLKKTFRDSDVIARLGGDEFAVLAIEASGHSEATIMARLQKYLNTINAQEGRCTVSLSVGVARFDHGKPTSIRDLMAQADQAMYEQKRGRSSSRIEVGVSLVEVENQGSSNVLVRPSLSQEERTQFGRQIFT